MHRLRPRHLSVAPFTQQLEVTIGHVRSRDRSRAAQSGRPENPRPVSLVAAHPGEPGLAGRDLGSGAIWVPRTGAPDMSAPASSRTGASCNANIAERGRYNSPRSMLDVHLTAAAKEARRAEQRIQRLREEALFLVDEIFDLEAQLRYPPARICPCCDRPMPSESRTAVM